MPDIETTCCFTGHRASKLPWKYREDDLRCIRLKQQIYDTVEAVYDSGIRHYICGMANGCDLYFGEAVLQLRQLHPDITLEAAVPYEGQAKAGPLIRDSGGSGCMTAVITRQWSATATHPTVCADGISIWWTTPPC